MFIRNKFIAMLFVSRRFVYLLNNIVDVLLTRSSYRHTQLLGCRTLIRACSIDVWKEWSSKRIIYACELTKAREF